MSITTLSSRAFNQDSSGAKKAAAEGPVFITDRGRPAHVLLHHRRLPKADRRQAEHRRTVSNARCRRVELVPRRGTVCTARRSGLMFILDTNVVAVLRKSKSGAADKNVTAWASRVSASSLYLSVITLLELKTGVLRVERRDAAQGAIFRTWLSSYVLPAFSGRILAIDVAVARRCAPLHVPDRRSERDVSRRPSPATRPGTRAAVARPVPTTPGANAGSSPQTLPARHE